MFSVVYVELPEILETRDNAVFSGFETAEAAAKFAAELLVKAGLAVRNGEFYEFTEDSYTYSAEELIQLYHDTIDPGCCLLIVKEITSEERNCTG